MRLIDADALKYELGDTCDGEPIFRPTNFVRMDVIEKAIDEAPTVEITYEELIKDVRSMICKVNDYYGYTDSMHMFKVLFDQKYHGWKCERR